MDFYRFLKSLETPEEAEKRARRKAAKQKQAEEQFSGVTTKALQEKYAHVFHKEKTKQTKKISSHPGRDACTYASEALSAYNLHGQVTTRCLGTKRTAGEGAHGITDGEIVVEATIVPVFGMKSVIEIPIQVKAGYMLQPGLIVHKGIPMVLSQSAIDDIVSGDAYFDPPTSERKNLFSPTAQVRETSPSFEEAVVAAAEAWLAANAPEHYDDVMALLTSDEGMQMALYSAGREGTGLQDFLDPKYGNGPEGFDAKSFHKAIQNDPAVSEAYQEIEAGGLDSELPSDPMSRRMPQNSRGPRSPVTAPSSRPSRPGPRGPSWNVGASQKTAGGYGVSGKLLAEVVQMMTAGADKQKVKEFLWKNKTPVEMFETYFAAAQKKLDAAKAKELENRPGHKQEFMDAKDENKSLGYGRFERFKTWLNESKGPAKKAEDGIDVEAGPKIPVSQISKDDYLKMKERTDGQDSEAEKAKRRRQQRNKEMHGPAFSTEPSERYLQSPSKVASLSCDVFVDDVKLAEGTKLQIVASSNESVHVSTDDGFEFFIHPSCLK